MVKSAVASNPPQIPAVQARPPTPPRDSRHNELKLGLLKDSRPSLLGDLTRFFKSDPKHKRAAAPATSTSAIESSVQTPGSGSGTGKKKVVWSESMDYSDPPIASFDGQHIRRTVQPLAPSSERKPSKSILKISSNGGNGGNEQEHIEGASTKLLPPHRHASFSTMLDSIVQQLGGEDRSSKMDAYLMFSGLLKASDNVPDPKALKSKIGLLCQFIIQDLSKKLGNDKPDTALVVNALVLLSSFLQKPAIAEMVPADFSVQVVEHAIEAFKDTSASKEIVKHLMFIMAQQNFSAKVLTQERVGRLILALHDIENHIKGKSIVMSRISILRTLLRSSRSHIMANTVWFGDMFNDMLSSLKEIRKMAIAFGFEAAVTLGAEDNSSRAVSSLFKIVNKDMNFGNYYADRLKDMIKTKNDSAAVPQIWSIVILFLRSTPKTLLQWQFFTRFLEVIQLCFNSSDNLTRLEANVAWNRLVFVIQPNDKTPIKFRCTLTMAIVKQLKTRKSLTGRRSCLSSIYILLYYAFKPQSTSAQLDTSWDDYLVPVIDGFLACAKGRGDSELARQDAVEACIILYSLFDTKTPRKWYEARAVDSLHHNPMIPAELPALDSKWLRKNHIRVFKVLNPLMEMLYWDLCDDSEISKVWTTYIASIGSPAAGEVIISQDTMSSIASMYGLLHRFWLAGEKIAALVPLDIPPTTSAFIRSFENIILPAVSDLQISPFSDKLLGISQDTFVAVATPSQAPRKHLVEMKSPLYHLILLLARPSPGLEYDRQFFRMVDQILNPFIVARTGKAQLGLIYSLVHLLPSGTNEPLRIIWQVLADYATTAVDTRTNNESGGEEPLNSKYLNVVQILETGVNLFPNGPLPTWRHLFDALINLATFDAGDAGRALGVIDPVAKIFTPRVPSVGLSSKGMFYLDIVLGKANYPKDRQALDLAHRKLRGTGIPNPKSKSYDPYVHLYQYTNAALISMYKSFSKGNVREYSDVLSATTGILGRCPTSLLLPVMTKIQPGIEYWILDNDRRLVSGDGLSKSVASLWTMVKRLIPRLVEHYDHTTILRELETLMCAGLDSKHGSLVNGTITFWNTAFGSCEEAFEYPDNLKEALLRLRAIADVQVPHLFEAFEAEPSADQRQPIDFMDTQDDSYELSSMSKELIPRLVGKSIPQVILNSRRSTSLRRSRDNTPKSSRWKSMKRDITPRIRHDDSQIRFAAVDSSPMAARVVDSQLFTEKQKETKEKQQTEQSMFPDLRSTPNSRERSVRMPEEAEMELPSRQSSQLQAKPLQGRQTTPTLPIPSDDDGFVASSPTPTRSLRAGPGLEIDPPSSPPGAPAQAACVEFTSTSLEHTPDPVVARALASKPVQTDEDIASSSLDSIPEPGEAIDLDGGSINEERAETPEKNDGHIEMDLHPTAEIDEEHHDLPGHQVLNIEDRCELVNETASFGPPAQMESLQNVTMSTFEFTPELRYSSPVEEDLLEQLKASQMEEDMKELVEEELENVTQIKLGDGAEDESEEELYHDSQQFRMIHLLEPLPPGTPVRNHASPPLGQKPPKSTDAPTSPTSSDRQDIFEDAISSPRAKLGQKTPAQNPSTPDFYGTADVASFLRAVDSYDQPDYFQKDSFVEETGTSSRKTRSSASRAFERSSSIEFSLIRKPALKKTSNIQVAHKEPGSSTSIAKSSSIPSLIPETPGIDTTGNPVERYVDYSGTECDPAETIVVDCSSLEHSRPAVKCGSRKGKKRKFHETGDGSNEIPDSQDAMARSETSSPTKRSPSKRSPAKKRRGARQSRASQVSQEASDAESIQDFQSQSEWGDLDATREEMEIYGATMPFTSNAEESVPTKEPEIEQSFEGSIVRQEAEEIWVEQSIAKNTEDVDMEDVEYAEETTGPNINVMEETTVDATNIFETSPVEPENYIDEKVAYCHSPELPAAEVHAHEADAEPVEPEVLVPGIRSVVEPQKATLQSMKEKLQSLLGDLESSSLSRSEVHEFEDLFMDVKRKLYDAEKRGRESVDGR